MDEIELDVIKHGDCLDLLRDLDADSIDLIVTDPPYGISFMGKDWDRALPPTEVWSECLRVLKPGAFAFVMCGPRQDVLARMIIRLENAKFQMGFTSVFWAYATGFPKSINIAKAIDRRAGIEPEVVGARTGPDGRCRTLEPSGGKDRPGLHDGGIRNRTEMVTKPVSEEARRFEGSYGGYQPKPVVELILVCMKPISEDTFTEQALKNGHGITWLDDGRIPISTDELEKMKDNRKANRTIRAGPVAAGYGMKPEGLINSEQHEGGRFAPNLLVEDDVLDDGKIRKSSGGNTIRGKESKVSEWGYKEFHMAGYGDEGGFSDFFSLDRWWDRHGWATLDDNVKDTFPYFIVPKPSREEKEKGLEQFEERACRGSYEDSSQFGLLEKIQNSPRPKARNIHPTVKPIKLMSYLITIGSRMNDVILDPFVGSGTTAIAAKRLSRRYIGFELDEEYHRIATARLQAESSAMDWF